MAPVGARATLGLPSTEESLPMKGLLAAAMILGFAGAAAACPFSASTKTPDQTAETVLPPAPTAGS